MRWIKSGPSFPRRADFCLFFTFSAGVETGADGGPRLNRVVDILRAEMGGLADPGAVPACAKGLLTPAQTVVPGRLPVDLGLIQR